MTTFTAKSVLPSSASKSLKDNMVKFVAADLRLFAALEGEIFLSLRQIFVDYGTKYGHFDV